MVKKKKYLKETVNIEILTVKMAESLIKNHPDFLHRKVSQIYVQRYIDAQKRGKWLFSGQDNIVIDWYGNLLNGNHRCFTIILSKIPMKVVIIRGIDPEAFKVMDIGKRRTLSDCLFINGEQYWQELSAALIMLDAYKYGMIIDGKRDKFQNEDALILLKKNPGLKKCISMGVQLKQKHILSTGIAAFLFHIFLEKNEKQAKIFFNRLLAGTNLEQNSPILRLRETMIDNKSRQLKFRRIHKLCLVIKAWNAFRKDLPVTAITWRDAKHPQEAIPDII